MPRENQVLKVETEGGGEKEVKEIEELQEKWVRKGRQGIMD